MTNFRKLQNEELNRISTEAFKEAPKIPVVILLDNVRSQNNVGSVFRTSDAFRIEKIFLCGITSTPENREVHKTALGAEDAVEWEYVKDTVEAVDRLKKEVTGSLLSNRPKYHSAGKLFPVTRSEICADLRE